MGTVDNWVLSPGGDVLGTRNESHRISPLSEERFIELFRVIVGDPNGLGIKDSTPWGLDEGG